jgi:hypothetical protein
MEDIFYWCRENNAIQVRLWLDDTENDMNQGIIQTKWNPNKDFLATRSTFGSPK